MTTTELQDLCDTLSEHICLAECHGRAEGHLAVCYEIHNQIGGELRARMDAARKTPHPMDAGTRNEPNSKTNRRDVFARKRL